MTRRARPTKPGKRRATRLAAVQALYQIDLTGTPMATVVEEFRRFRLAPSNEDAKGAAADSAAFGHIVEETIRRQDEIDAMLTGALAEGWTLVRLETVLRAILRAGAGEMIASPDVPVRVAIDEYVEIAHGFFAGKEPGFVNGVLDRLARRLRPAEFSGPHDGANARKKTAQGG